MKKCIPNEHICKICNTNYSSRQNLWKHTNKYHTDLCIQNVTNMLPNVTNMLPNVTNQNPAKCNTCNICNKILSNRHSRWRHEQICKEIETESLKNKLIETESKINTMSQQIAQLLNEKAKIHPKTLQKINKNLINNINNGTIINNTFVKFGKVELSSILNTKEILSILNQPFISIEETIKKIHFNDKHPEYKNIYITNMKDDIAYIFNGIQYITVRKNDVIMDLINNCTEEIESSFDENKDKMKLPYIKRLESFLELINNDEKYFDGFNKPYSNYKTYKIGDIKRFIYDNSNAKHLALLNTLELKCQEIELK